VVQFVLILGYEQHTGQIGLVAPDESMNGLDLYFSREYLKAAVMVCLLSVWVLVGLFYYLNRYTRRQYFTIWTGAWLFYALWITLSFGLQNERPQPWLMMLEQWCIGVSAVFLFWGSERFLGERVSQRLIGWFLLFLLVWSYTSAFHLEDPLEIEVPLFTLIGFASLFTARSFFRYRRKHGYIGATLLTLGFLLWGMYMAGYPFLENSKDLISVALFISAGIQLLVAVSMIILVLEEVRTSHQTTIEQLHLRKLATEALETKVASTEERYRSLFEHASEAIVITDTADLRILVLNRAAEHLLGILAADAGNHSLDAFCQLPSQRTALKTAPDCFEELRSTRPLNLVRKNGGVVQAEIDGAEIIFDGKPGYQFFIRELTERVRLEQQLRQAEKLSALGQMISGVAHELNNPLAVIKGYLELVLSHHDLPPQTRANLEKVANESNRATKLVRNFLTFAREQSARREAVQLNDIVQRVVELRRFNFAISAVDAQTELAANLPPVAADPDQIQQVLINLLDNALHAVVNRPGRARIKVTTQATEDSVCLRVEDNGPGVPEELVTKIFEPFFTTKEVGTGTGLGLSIAHTLMLEHHGRIAYQTSSLGGAGFVLEFPVGDNITTPVPAPEPVPVSEPAHKAPASVGSVLVLDDEPAIAQMLAELLEIIGCSATLCHSPMGALELIEKQKFDLIVSDFRMPRMNGQQFYEAVKQRKPELAQRIIFLTGDVANHETQAFLNSIGNTHLDKPFNLASVEKAVAEVLEGVVA
jgi:PAS domain S-box-containing protein